MTEVILARILAGFGFTAAEIAAVPAAEGGYRNKIYPVGAYNLLLGKREAGMLERLRRADYYSEWAAAGGLPCRTQASQRTAVLGRETGGVAIYARLYHRLPGETIPWEGWTRRHIKLLGWAMGELHLVWQNIPDSAPPLPDALTELAELVKEMQHYFNQPTIRAALLGKTGVQPVEKLWKSCGKVVEKLWKKPQQALHLDLVRGNLLWKEGKKNLASKFQLDNLCLSGLIDFEKVARGPIELDLARTYAFLLVDCPKPAEKIQKYLLFDGYHKRAGRERIILPCDLVNLYLLYDFYKFLRHNPYESLAENYHYQRTRDLLLERGWIEVETKSPKLKPPRRTV